MANDTNDSVSTAKKKQRKALYPAIIIVVALLLIAMSVTATLQSNKIKKTMNEAAYSNTESTLRNLSEMISNTFAVDQRYLHVLASAISISNPQEWLDTVDYDPQKIQGIFYRAKDAGVAIGKNGTELNVSDYTFIEHKNGQVRSKPFMTVYGTYSYLLREPIKSDGETVGYLYMQYPMNRFKNILPQNVANGNDVSLMEASTLTYVYIPSTSSSGVHVNYKNLKYYLNDPSKAPAVIEEIESAISENKYYMRILSFSHSEQSEMNAVDYVVFLWPVDDGEYYISGFSRLDYLQGERVSVENTLNAMISMLLGICLLMLILLAVFFGNIALSNKKKAELQQKYNKELNEALQLAKIANESKSNFLSNMSHDIRTPMNAIIGYTTLIDKEADEPEKVREYIKKISGAGDYLLSLINDVLDMSKIESGKTTLNVSAFSIQEMVSEVESIIRMQTDSHQQTFTVKIESVKNDSVMGDKLRIRQIVLNLLSNAVKYTPNGGKINFTVQGIPQPKKANLQKIRIVVQDTGYGMDESYIKTIFEPFTRLNNTMTGKIQGTGLGLAITKNIVNLMGGTITVNSIPNKGSTFAVELELPVAKDDVASQNAAANADKTDSFDLSGLHILAAEDNELNAEILSELLAMENVTCKICSDGEKIVSEFENSEPGTYDLLLMDIQMPNMNGYEATKNIRASSHPEAKTIPIVAMTANAFAEDVLDALQAGMNAHIAKPVDMNAMKKTFSQVLKKRKEG